MSEPTNEELDALLRSQGWGPTTPQDIEAARRGYAAGRAAALAEGVEVLALVHAPTGDVQRTGWHLAVFHSYGAVDAENARVRLYQDSEVRPARLVLSPPDRRAGGGVP